MSATSGSRRSSTPRIGREGPLGQKVFEDLVDGGADVLLQGDLGTAFLGCGARGEVGLAAAPELAGLLQAALDQVVNPPPSLAPVRRKASVSTMRLRMRSRSSAVAAFVNVTTRICCTVRPRSISSRRCRPHRFHVLPVPADASIRRVPESGQASYGGMEIQILDDQSPRYRGWLHDYQRHGSIYGVVAAKTGYLKPVGEWNHLPELNEEAARKLQLAMAQLRGVKEVLVVANEQIACVKVESSGFDEAAVEDLVAAAG